MSPRDASTHEIVIACPACAKRLFLSEAFAGKRMACPKCYQAFVVPDASEKAPASVQVSAGKAAAPEVVTSKAALARGVDYIPVVCGLCKTRMYVTRDQIGKKVKCPDCYSYTVVKKPDEFVAKKRPEIVGYAVRQDEPLAPAAEQEVLVPLFCRVCHTRMHAPASQIGYPMACPDCGTTTIVPRPDPNARKNTAPDLVAGKYDVGAQQVKAPPPRRIVQPEAIENRREVAELPRWTFFSGVFTFPWRREALARWVYLSAGMIVTELLAAFITSLLASGDKMLVVGAGFAGLALLWFSVWTYSFASACFLAIVEDTANGADEVTEWPSGDWRDWLFPLVQVIFVQMIAGAIGYLVTLVLGAAGITTWLPVPVATFFLFPFLLLSMLETNSVLNPFSPPIMKSLFTFWWGWLLYYVLAAVPIVLWLAVAAGSILFVGALAAAVIVGPVQAAVVLIEARLLGRLAWRASLSGPDDFEESE